MYVVDRTIQFVRGFLLSYGPSNLKRAVWDKEYGRNKWHFAENSVGDCVYPYLEKYAKKGSILDIGCGSGNTANELDAEAYQSYIGIDISKEALAKATQRSKENGRGEKNRFECADFLGYMPSGKFNVILFRESMYHVPLGKIVPMLQKYAAHLKDDGVFIVRMYVLMNGKEKFRPARMFHIIESNFEVLEKSRTGDWGATVMAFRPKKQH
jgi:SAM-dependent methyltransferase